MLEKYTKVFSNLRTDKGRNRYPAVTGHRAPHKPFLLLSIIDLIAQGQITTNFIAPSFDLLATFNGYWSVVMPAGAKTSMAYSFSRLRTDGLWHRIPEHGYDPDIECNASSDGTPPGDVLWCKGGRRTLRLYDTAAYPEHLRMVRMNTYFAPEIHPLLVQLGKANLEAYSYSQSLFCGVGASQV